MHPRKHVGVPRAEHQTENSHLKNSNDISSGAAWQGTKATHGANHLATITDLLLVLRASPEPQLSPGGTQQCGHLPRETTKLQRAGVMESVSLTGGKGRRLAVIQTCRLETGGSKLREHGVAHGAGERIIE